LTNKRPYLVVFLFCCRLLNSQIDYLFLNHLTKNGLQNEHRTYLNTIKSNSDSLFYCETVYYANYFNDTAFIKNYRQSKPMCDKDSLLLRKASQHIMISKNVALQKLWFDTLCTLKSEWYHVYKSTLYPKKFPDDFFGSPLQKSFRAYKKVSSKSPALAAVFSTIVPGTGKMYCGKWRSGLMAFLMNTTYAIQFAESYKKLSIKHPLNLINIGAFGVFYLTNIYGSYKSVIELRRETKKQFLSEAINYYN
jgi:hypothetical protein